MRNATHQCRAFTLAELMVVASVILVLASLVFSLVTVGFERANRVRCNNQVRQQVIALRALAADHSDRYYWPAEDIFDDSGPSFLYPEYIANLEVFICPATKNHISDAVDPGTGKRRDLLNNAHDRHATSGGHSYEYFGYYFYAAPTGGFQIKGPNYHQKVPPEWTVLVLDADDEGEINFPERNNNHGAAGWNWGFADGHVEWVTQDQTREMLLKTATGRVPRK